MATELHDPLRALGELHSPPRDVPLGLRCRLLTGTLVLTSAGIFAFTMSFPIALPTDTPALLILPGGALLMTVLGIRSGWRKVRLLRDGMPALAMMTACISRGEDASEMPVADYKRHIAAAWFPGIEAFLAFAQVFRLFWLFGLIAVLLFGLVILVGGLVFLGFAATDPASALPMLFGFFGFCVLWVTVGAFLLRTAGVGQFGGKFLPRWHARCLFEFQPPGGTVLQVEGVAMLHPDETEEPPQVVLYDPANAGHASLLSRIHPDLAVARGGGWEVPGVLLPLVRVVTVVVLSTGPMVSWLLMLAR